MTLTSLSEHSSNSRDWLWFYFHIDTLKYFLGYIVCYRCNMSIVAREPETSIASSPTTMRVHTKLRPRARAATLILTRASPSVHAFDPMDRLKGTRGRRSVTLSPRHFNQRDEVSALRGRKRGGHNFGVITLPRLLGERYHMVQIWFIKLQSFMIYAKSNASCVLVLDTRSIKTNNQNNQNKQKKKGTNEIFYCVNVYFFSRFWAI